VSAAGREALGGAGSKRQVAAGGVYAPSVRACVRACVRVCVRVCVVRVCRLCSGSGGAPLSRRGLEKGEGRQRLVLGSERSAAAAPTFRLRVRGNDESRSHHVLLKVDRRAA